MSNEAFIERMREREKNYDKEVVGCMKEIINDHLRRTNGGEINPETFKSVCKEIGIPEKDAN